jgi:hypothetical protein
MNDATRLAVHQSVSSFYDGMIEQQKTLMAIFLEECTPGPYSEEIRRVCNDTINKLRADCEKLLSPLNT